MPYLNGDVVTVDAYVPFYPTQWAQGALQIELYKFSCMGKMIWKPSDKVLRFHLHGALANKALAYKTALGRPSKASVVEPLRLALETRLGVPVVPFTVNVIEGGTQ